jgi:hypothetical protein
VNIQENEKKVSLLTARIFAKKAIVFTISILMTSVVIAYAAGYSIADFITPEDESGQSYGGSDSKHSFADEFSYAKLIDFRSLRSDFGGACYIDRSGYVTGYSYPIADAAARAFISGDGIMKNFVAPAGTYGDAGSVIRTALFKDDRRSDFNIPEDPAPGWYPNVAKGSSNAGSGGAIIIIYPLPDQGSGSGSGSGSGPAPTPIPAALPLFGSGLALLFVLRRGSKS